LLEIAKPKFVNASSSPTSIDTLFFLPGLFNRLIIELPNVNQTCSIEYSLINSPFYHCLFQNLTSSQWFILNYYSLRNDEQAPSGDVTIVYTGMKKNKSFRKELIEILFKNWKICIFHVN
jgi:hypothetical protein